MTESKPGPLSFEQALQQLDGIVRSLEDGDTSLEESLAQYEKGIGLLKLCYGQLRQAEQRVQKLTGESADGQPILELFEHVATVVAKDR